MHFHLLCLSEREKPLYVILHDVMLLINKYRFKIDSPFFAGFLPLNYYLIVYNVYTNVASLSFSFPVIQYGYLMVCCLYSTKDFRVTFVTCSIRCCSNPLSHLLLEVIGDF